MPEGCTCHPDGDCLLCADREPCDEAMSEYVETDPCQNCKHADPFTVCPLDCPHRDCD